MALKWKVLALVMISLSLVTTTACKKKKKDAEKKAKEVCAQMERTCKDGSKGVREDETGCYLKCPEDIKFETNTVTNTSTSTVTVTNSASNTAN